MTDNNDVKSANALRVLLILASLVVIIAGMQAAKSILVPFLLSVFIAIICSPMLFWLRKKGLPAGLSLLAVVALVLICGFFFGALVGSSVNDFSQSLPAYQERLSEKTSAVVGLLAKFGVEISDKVLQEHVDPGAAMQMASKLLTGIGNMLSNTFLILLTVIFILLEASTFPSKMLTAFGETSKSHSTFETFMDNVNRYMAIKTWMSLGTGALVAIWLVVLGVDYPLLWGVLAFLFNYVPNIGSIIAAVPAILLALIQHGSTTAMLAGAGYVLFNIVIGNVIEPRFMGRGLGLSTLVVFLSLVFWGWVLGPVGMLLSIPLTMTVKIALSSNQETQWINTLLGTGEAAK